MEVTLPHDDDDEWENDKVKEEKKWQIEIDVPEITDGIKDASNISIGCAQTGRLSLYLC